MARGVWSRCLAYVGLAGYSEYLAEFNIETLKLPFWFLSTRIFV